MILNCAASRRNSLLAALLLGGLAGFSALVFDLAILYQRLREGSSSTPNTRAWSCSARLASSTALPPYPLLLGDSVSCVVSPHS